MWKYVNENDLQDKVPALVLTFNFWVQVQVQVLFSCQPSLHAVNGVTPEGCRDVGVVTSCSHRGRLLSSQRPVPTPSSAVWAWLWMNLRPAAQRHQLHFHSFFYKSQIMFCFECVTEKTKKKWKDETTSDRPVHPVDPVDPGGQVSGSTQAAGK